MKKKILISILIFLILLVYSSNVLGFVLQYEDNVYLISDDEMLEYIVVFPVVSATSTYFRVVTSDCEFITSNDFVYLKGNVKQFWYYPSNSNLTLFYNKNISTYGTLDKISKLVYSNKVIYDEEGKVGYEPGGVTDLFQLKLSVNPLEQTVNVPVIIASQLFTETGILKYELQYSLDNKTFKDTHIRSINSVNNTVTLYQFYYEAYSNDTYYFRLRNRDTGEYIYNEVTIDNIVVTQDNVNNYVDGVFDPHPFLNYEYVSDTEINITTQKFFEDEILKIECSYAKDITNNDLQNEEVWNSVSIRSLTDTAAKLTSYQFYLNVKNDDGTGDGTYYFRFYNKELDKYTYTTIEVTFQDIVEYHASTSEINQQFNRFVSFFKDKFGFLAYPFELIVDILKRIGSIKFEEPVINIPDIYDTVTDVKIISATQLNFNDILEEDEVFKNIHDIYLIIVDVILCFGIAMFAKNKIMKVLSK